MKRKVMCMAHEIAKATSKSMAVSLSMAWMLVRLTKRMRAGVVEFTYEKVDGTLRRAKGTLIDTEQIIKGTGTPNYKTVKYYDVDAEGFRSFRVTNLISVY